MRWPIPRTSLQRITLGIEQLEDRTQPSVLNLAVLSLFDAGSGRGHSDTSIPPGHAAGHPGVALLGPKVFTRALQGADHHHRKRHGESRLGWRRRQSPRPAAHRFSAGLSARTAPRLPAARPNQAAPLPGGAGEPPADRGARAPCALPGCDRPAYAGSVQSRGFTSSRASISPAARAAPETISNSSDWSRSKDSRWRSTANRAGHSPS